MRDGETGSSLLVDWGWGERWAQLFQAHARKGLEPARVLTGHRGGYTLRTERAEYEATVPGRFRHLAERPADFPAVGDWVAVTASAPVAPAVEVPSTAVSIEAVLPRASAFSRRAPGRRTEEQVVAANVDVAFLVSGLDHDFNLRRIERYVALAWSSGAAPEIVLNKADLCADISARELSVRAIAPGVPVHPVSAATGAGIDRLRAALGRGRTAALLGSSGVGKSSIANALLGESVQAVGEVRGADDRGRHTTRARQLLLLPTGGLLVDTPGMRELQLWDADDGLEEAFADFDAVALNCRFNDCAHEREPGCAVRAAIESGLLGEERPLSWRKLQLELELLAARASPAARAEARRRYRTLGRAAREAIAAKSSRPGHPPPGRVSDADDQG